MRINEFMVIKNKYGEYGVIIRNESLNYPFRIAYKSGGQIFSSSNYKDYIIEAYECIRNKYEDIIYCALQFLNNPEMSINNYCLIYKQHDEENNNEEQS